MNEAAKHEFIFLLNALENAGQQDRPARRNAVIAHVANVRLSTTREITDRLDAEALLYARSSRACDASGNIAGAARSAAAETALRRMSVAIRLLALCYDCEDCESYRPASSVPGTQRGAL